MARTLIRRALPMIAAAALAVPPGTAPQTRPAPEVRRIDEDGYARMLASMKGRAVVVNMWATWCEPCREEFPDLVRLDREMRRRGVRVIAISMDEERLLESDVIPFLTRHGASLSAYIRAEGDEEAFIDTVDPGWSGALPATFVYDTSGRLVRRLVGRTRLDELERIVAPLAPCPQGAP